MTYQCGTCDSQIALTLDAARMLGWRIWDGESQTGKPMSVRICPVCAGVEEPQPEPSWLVGCDTCGWEYWEEDDGPLTEKQARRMADDHKCEPETWVRPPITPEDQAKYDALVNGRRVVTIPLAGVS